MAKCPKLSLGVGLYIDFTFLVYRLYRIDHHTCTPEESVFSLTHWPKIVCVWNFPFKSLYVMSYLSLVAESVFMCYQLY